jgi:3-methyladenine DNA glycosylase/8-oxoguanine DNA glycosylase
VLARAWQRRDGALVVRAEAVEPELVRRHRADGGGGRVRAPGRLAARRRGDAGEERAPAGRQQGDPGSERAPAGEDELAIAVERMRFVLGVDYDLGEFHRRFRRDPLIGPLIRRMPSFRPRRRVWPWEALAAAVVGQLIEAQRAVGIERRIVGRWGPRLGEGAAELRDVPGAATIAGRAPAELESMDLSPNRALALWRVARAVAAGRCPIEDEVADRRLLAMPQIGPWTVQCLQLFGRGEMDALPAGDLGYIKLVGRLAGMGRRATVPEVEEFFAPYEPHRGLAGTFALAAYHGLVASGPPLRLAA